MGLFSQRQAGAPQDQRSLLTNQYNAGRNNLLLVAIFTIVNVILLITNSNLYFLFSASLPYMLADIFMDICGMYPAEYYEYWYEVSSVSELEFLPISVFIAGIAIAFIFALVYILFYFLSKNGKAPWLIASLVFFCIDTLVMFYAYGISISNLIDILFHVWVIVILSMAIRAHFKLKTLSTEENSANNTFDVAPDVALENEADMVEVSSEESSDEE